MNNTTAGQKALNARKSRIATALVKKGYLTPEQAKAAADYLIGYGVTTRQVEASQASLNARRHIGNAIKFARAL